MQKIRGFIQLMRPIGCTMMSFAFLVGAFLARQSFSNFSLLNAFLGAATGFTLTAAAMGINDYFDRNIDAINEPSRPIPSGAVTPMGALIFTAVFSALGILFSALINTICLVIAVIDWILLITYSAVGKQSGLPGNLLVSVCVVIPFLYGNFAVANVAQLNVLLFAGMAFFLNTGREITKGIMDIEGDKAENVKTLAVRFGAKKAALAAAIFNFLAICLSPIPLLLNFFSLLYLPFMVLIDLCLLLSSLLLVKNPTREKASQTKKFFVLVTVAAFLGLAISVIR